MIDEELEELLRELEDLCWETGVDFLGIISLPGFPDDDFIAVGVTTAYQHMDLIDALKDSEICHVLDGETPQITDIEGTDVTVIAWKLS